MWIDNADEIQHESWSYFSNIYRNSESYDAHKTHQTLDHINIPSLTNAHFNILSDPVTQDEIDRTVFERVIVLLGLMVFMQDFSKYFGTL